MQSKHVDHLRFHKAAVTSITAVGTALRFDLSGVTICYDHTHLFNYCDFLRSFICKSKVHAKILVCQNVTFVGYCELFLTLAVRRDCQSAATINRHAANG